MIYLGFTLLYFILFIHLIYVTEFINSLEESESVGKVSEMFVLEVNINFVNQDSRNMRSQGGYHYNHIV